MCLQTEKILKAIEKELQKANQQFFEFVWREKVENILKEEDRYTKLVCWIDKEIEARTNAVAIFNPADKTESYTNELFKIYQQQIGELAMLVQMRDMILDNKCTTEIRNNIEYALCKIFKIHYNKELEDYVS